MAILAITKSRNIVSGKLLKPLFVAESRRQYHSAKYGHLLWRLTLVVTNHMSFTTFAR